jgi:hypothetical protein
LSNSGKSVIAGGNSNSGNSAFDCAIGGGDTNVVGPGSYATIPGGRLNQAINNYTFAAGHNSRAIHSGSFVFTDGTGVAFTSTAVDSFVMRFDGGVAIGTNAPLASTALTVAGNTKSTQFADTYTTTAFSATPTFNWALGAVTSMTLTGNITSSSFSNALQGQTYTIKINTGAGGFTVVFPAAVKWPAATAPTITAAAGKTDIISFFYDGTDYWGFIGGQNYTT